MLQHIFSVFWEINQDILWGRNGRVWFDGVWAITTLGCPAPQHAWGVCGSIYGHSTGHPICYVRISDVSRVWAPTAFWRTTASPIVIQEILPPQWYAQLLCSSAVYRHYSKSTSSNGGTHLKTVKKCLCKLLINGLIISISTHCPLPLLEVEI